MGLESPNKFYNSTVMKFDGIKNSSVEISRRRRVLSLLTESVDLRVPALLDVVKVVPPSHQKSVRYQSKPRSYQQLVFLRFL